MLKARAEVGVQMSEVFFVACGGSLVDLYPAKFFLASESRLLRNDLYTANEFVHAVPKVLGERSVVIFCSHSGVTPEIVEAVKVAKAAGSLTVSMTHNKSSELAAFSDHNIVYEWGAESKALRVVKLLDGVHQRDVPVADEFEQRHRTRQMFLRDRNDQAEVGSNDLIFQFVGLQEQTFDGFDIGGSDVAHVDLLAEPVRFELQEIVSSE